MLVLTRRPGESLILKLPDGRTIEMIVLQKRQNAIRIGINAPDDVNIRRSEVPDRDAI